MMTLAMMVCGHTIDQNGWALLSVPAFPAMNLPYQLQQACYQGMVGDADGGIPSLRAMLAVVLQERSWRQAREKEITRWQEYRAELGVARRGERTGAASQEYAHVKTQIEQLQSSPAHTREGTSPTQASVPVSSNNAARAEMAEGFTWAQPRVKYDRRTRSLCDLERERRFLERRRARYGALRRREAGQDSSPYYKGEPHQLASKRLRTDLLQGRKFLLGVFTPYPTPTDDTGKHVFQPYGREDAGRRGPRLGPSRRREVIEALPKATAFVHSADRRFSLNPGHGQRVDDRNARRREGSRFAPESALRARRAQKKKEQRHLRSTGGTEGRKGHMMTSAAKRASVRIPRVPLAESAASAPNETRQELAESERVRQARLGSSETQAGSQSEPDAKQLRAAEWWMSGASTEASSPHERTGMLSTSSPPGGSGASWSDRASSGRNKIAELESRLKKLEEEYATSCRHYDTMELHMSRGSGSGALQDFRPSMPAFTGPASSFRSSHALLSTIASSASAHSSPASSSSSSSSSASSPGRVAGPLTSDNSPVNEELIDPGCDGSGGRYDEDASLDDVIGGKTARFCVGSTINNLQDLLSRLHSLQEGLDGQLRRAEIKGESSSNSSREESDLNSSSAVSENPSGAMVQHATKLDHIERRLQTIGSLLQEGGALESANRA